MENSSSNFRPSRKVSYFLLTVLILAGIFFAVNLSCSIVLNKHAQDWKRDLLSKNGWVVTGNRVSFNILRGITLKNVRGFLASDKDYFFTLGRLDIGLDLLSLFRGKVLIKSLSAHKFFLNMRPEANLKMGLGGLSDASINVSEFFETMNWSIREFDFNGALKGDVLGYISRVQSDQVVCRGTLFVRKIVNPFAEDIDIFAGSHFYKPFDYALEIQLKKNGFDFSRFEVSNPSLRVLGKGGYESGRWDVGLDFSNIVLDDLPALNDENLTVHGVVDCLLRISGSLENLSGRMRVNFSNTDLIFYQSIFLTKIKGSADIDSRKLQAPALSLIINQMPFVADVRVRQEDVPHIDIDLSSQAEIEDENVFALSASADWREDKLTGDALIRASYGAKDSLSSLVFDLKGFSIGYKDELFFRIKSLDTQLSVSSLRQRAKKTIFDKSFSATDVFGILRKSESKMLLNPLNAVCYGGDLSSNFSFASPAKDQVAVDGEVHLRAVGIADFFSDSAGESSLRGRLDGDFKINTQAADVIRGQVFINEGMIKDHPLLNAVADFLGVLSLKKIDFDELSIAFNGGKGDYISRVKLSSPEVLGDLDGRIVSYDKMDGYLSVSVASTRMKESRQFKKILAYIRHDEPFVTFPFKISSYLNSPRVLWLKNEFKEKLQKLLPERNKRYLQGQVNHVVEGMSVE